MTHTVEKRASYTSPRTDVTGMLVRPPRRVLDVGCSTGTLSNALRELGAETWGIEYDPEFAAEAETRLHHVLCGDGAERVEQLIQLGERFDVVICADSLEHMPDPWRVMRGVRRLVTDDSQVIVSLPNVRFFTTLWQVAVRGRWPYLERGLHDRTHLRWFTDHNAREMFSDAGFEVADRLSHYRIFDVPTRRNIVAKYLAVGPLRPFLAYQYVYRLRPVGPSV